MFRQQIARQARLFSTTPIARKTVVDSVKDSVKDAAKAVDRTISGAAVKGIEKGGTYSDNLSLDLVLLCLAAASNMTQSCSP